MDVELRRLLLVLGALATGTFAAFFLWSIESQYTYAALIPIIGGLLLAIPASAVRSLAQPRVGQAIGIAAWLVLAAAIVLGADGPRPVAFFWLVGLDVALFLLAALAHPRGAWHAAVGLAAIFLLVRWSSYHAFATFAGGDAFQHMRIVERIVVTHEAATTSVAGKYVTAPGFHYSVAVTRMVTGLGRSDAMFWAVVVAQLALPLGVFAFVRRWGAGFGPAAALAVLASESSLVFAGLHPIPGGLVLPLLVPFVVGLYRRDPQGVLLLIVAGLAGILTHHLTIVVSLLFVAVYAGWVAGAALVRRGPPADFLPIVVFLSLTIVFIIVHAVIAPTQGVTFFSKVVENLSGSTETAAPGAGEDLTLAERRSAFSSFLYKATLVIGSGFVVAAGARLITGGRRSEHATGIAALAVMVLAFALPFLGVDLVSDRWMPVVFIVGLLGMGALVMPWKRVSQVAITVGMVAFTMFGITQPAVMHDHGFYSAERNLALQYDEPDIVAASLAGPSPLVPYTDVAMVNLFRVFGGGAEQLTMPQANATQALPKDTLIVLRVDLFEEGRLHFGLRGNERFVLDDDPSDTFLRRLEFNSRILDAGSVRTYVTGG